MSFQWNVRWLFLLLPAYAFFFLGRAGLPLVAALAAGIVVYILTLEAAGRRWPEWLRQHALFVRLAEIGLACIALSLVYLKGSRGALTQDFYYDGFYAVFVILAAVAGGRRGAIVSAALATLAVIFGQIVQAPDAQALWGPGALAYWGAIGLYSLIYAGFFAAMAALALFAVEFQTRTTRWNTLLRLGREVTYLQEAVLVCDAHGTVTSVNPAAEQLFGGGAELWGHPLAALFGGALPYETTEPLEVAARRADGSLFDAEVSLST
ncbi:MAG: PAS domain-containing protein, partial [Gemmatimonadota bacterium]